MFNNNRYESELSIFFYGFIRWILNSCIEKKINTIYFLTREGEFYKKIYEQVVKAEEGNTIPRAEILEVSRLSTFAPSLRGIKISEFMRMWNMYQTQSMNAFFCSLGLKYDLFEEYLIKYQLDLFEPIQEPWKEQRVLGFLADQKVSELLENSIQEKRSQFYDYCMVKGLNPNETDTIAIVDIGWRGTIQDNLCILFPQKQIVGYYLCLAPFLNPQPINGIKMSYIDNHHSKIILRYPTPIEMLCNTSGGSVVGYEKGRSIRIIEPDEERCYFTFTEEAQSKILSGIRGMHGKEDPRAVKYMDKLILYPEKKMVRAFFTLRHNETFGIGTYVNKNKKMAWILFPAALFCRKYRQKLKYFLWETTWPQGFFVYYHMRYAAGLYNYILKKGFLHEQACK